ncbi:uncharacterized protein LOC121369889 [Gigantopelta aegis]|uniref:uncharacterized protein LOC121369889 n=1 Tax=Gigantopelta aegis TaxID=1735272 RepID=UPI001B889154|nr:uncharacterized protein LOC121369889 [Gigantopelta aegis]
MSRTETAVGCLLFASLITALVSSDPGPKYPITASWFKDRFTLEEWNKTLTTFQTWGGDTVFLRAPPMIKRSIQDLARDPNFAWCGSLNSSTGVGGTKCWDEAVNELSALGVKIAAFATYQYEENFGDSFMVCPKFDRKLSSSRIYYRLVLPTVSQSDPCNITSGSSVIVLFTSFAGTDPHELLLTAAAQHNTSVFFGAPALPVSDDINLLLPAYYELARRVMVDHKTRYSKMFTGDMQHFITSETKDKRRVRKPIKSKSLYDFLGGYYSTDECFLGWVTSATLYPKLYTRLGALAHSVGKRFAISPYVDTNRSQVNSTVKQHLDGFQILVSTKSIDIIAVQEGRGAGKACYYWPTQIDDPVSEVDPKLDEVIRYLDPSLKANVTFRHAFTASNQELFRGFGGIMDSSKKKGLIFEYWLNIEAFEYLRSDPCLPVDVKASAMSELLQRSTKFRMDRGLQAAGSTAKKVISFAWDSDFVCTTNQHKYSLASEIIDNYNQPIISNCSFHNSFNLSVVIIGYSLVGMYDQFTIDWPKKDGTRRQDDVYGYYFEMDWGIQHNRVPSLVYVMLYDIPNMNVDLEPKGYVMVTLKDGGHPCVYVYDYS